ncbi:MAG: IS21 family transposase, partial [Bacteroidota bacterium]|nr:IS21 family transposase [Bacteroidota bacterium]
MPDQKIRSWIGAHMRALAFFGAVPKVVVCDNLKAAVTKPHSHHPKLALGALFPGVYPCNVSLHA